MEASFPFGPAEPYAWPGGYPIGYLVDDSEYLCARCVNDPTNPVHAGGDADGWRLEGMHVLEGSALDYDGPIFCAHCSRAIVEPQTHWHVAYGLAGYGPDAADSDGFAAFFSLAEALDYARSELSTDVDMAHEEAHALADDGRFEEAWHAVERMEALDLLRANLDPKRKSAPLYADDAEAYARLQETQAEAFPVDVSHSSRLYLWQCDEDACARDDS